MAATFFEVDVSDRMTTAKLSYSTNPIELAGVDRWLHGSTDEATRLARVPPVDVFDAVPEK